MKRLVSVALCVIIAMLVLYVPASAAADAVYLTSENETVSIESAAQFFITVGDDITGITADSLSVTVSHSSSYFDFVEAAFLVTDNTENNTVSDSTYTITYKSATELCGKVFQFSLIGLQTDVVPQTVTATVVAHKDGVIILNKSLETKVHLVCKEHDFEPWNNTAAADCENAGSRERSCSICNYTETEEIAAYGHDFKDMTVLRPATCLDIGYERGFCTHCEQKLLRKIPALGHDMSKFAVTKPASCTEKGLETSSCSRCTVTETRETKAIGHEFTKTVITTEPTIGKYGVKTCYCTRCSETTIDVVNCAYNDETLGVRLETTLGVFPESTETAVSLLSKGSSDYSLIERSIAHITNRFTGYTIETTHNGVAVHPNGDVTVTFTVPEAYGKKANFYYINDEGEVKKLSPNWNEDFTKATVKLVDIGYYAISKSGFDAAINSKTLLEKLSSTNIIITVSILLVLCWIIIVRRIIKAKKTESYRKITNLLPTRAEIRNAVKRNWFVFSTTLLIPYSKKLWSFITVVYNKIIKNTIKTTKKFKKEK